MYCIQLKVTFSLKMFIFVLSLVGLQIADGGSVNCPIGWFHYGLSCFLFSQNALNWFDAESSCRAHNARLAEVYAHDVAAFLRVTTNSYGYGYWLGGRDDVIEGTWQWASTSATFTVTNWAPGEPNSYHGHDQDCLCVLPNFGWDDEVCTAIKRYICESEIPGGNPIG